MRKRIMQIGVLLTVAVTMAVLAIGGMALAPTQVVAQTPPAQATQQSPHPVRLAGTITSVSSGSLSLATKNLTYTINVGTGTWIVVEQNGAATQGAATDLVAGKPAVVAGMTTADPKIVDARIVSQGIFRGAFGTPPGAPGKLGARGRPAIAQFTASGTIIAINGSTITLKGAVVAQVIVQTTADTIVVNNGFATVGTLKVGDSVQVLGIPVKTATNPAQPPLTPGPVAPGNLPASRTINAWALRVNNSASQLIVGHITSVSGNTLSIRTVAGKKDVTITVDSLTGYKTLSKTGKTITLSSGSLADLKNGSSLIIEATPSTTGGTFTAHAVIVLPGNAKPK